MKVQVIVIDHKDELGGWERSKIHVDILDIDTKQEEELAAISNIKIGEEIPRNFKSRFMKWGSLVVNSLTKETYTSAIDKALVLYKRRELPTFVLYNYPKNE